MAEAVLFDIAREIINKLTSLEEVVKAEPEKLKKLEKLKDTVESIRAVLLDAEEQSYGHNDQVTQWLGRLRDIFYDADELLDDSSYETLRRQVLSRKSEGEKACHFIFGCMLENEIKCIQERLDAIVVNMRSLALKVSYNEKGVMMNRDRETDSAVPYVVVGRENEKNEIVKFLLDSNNEEDVSILPIVGIGGLGKTTIAQLVFNDEQVKTHFQLQLWVCVSDPFDVKGIVKQMLELAPSDNRPMESLRKLLADKISKKRYLLVLDDVWNDDQNKWFNLKKLLRGGSSGSKIVITTRSEKVAKITSKLPSYVLSGLSDKESWSLLTKIVFNGEEPKNQSVLEIGKQIVKKCAGVPLAVRTIGSLLFFKEPQTWQSFMESEFSKIPQQETDIFPTLKLSYDHLPSHLKHCFAYCKLFPKDYAIDVKELIRLWIAQGFVRPSSHERSFQEMGMQCFKELLWRCFFQEVTYDERGNVIWCKMHDLMHDLATSMGGSETIMLDPKGKDVNEKTRHVSLFNYHRHEIEQLLTSSLKANKNNKVRTCLLRCGFDGDDKSQQVECIVRGFRSLMVLSFGRWNFMSLPSCIGKLRHLRYLDLSHNENMKVLPSSITQLHNLQFLILGGCKGLVELPEDIKDMVSLKYLNCSGCYELRYMPRGLGELTSLEALTVFLVDEKNEESRSFSKHRRSSAAGAGWNELSSLNKLNGDLVIRTLGSFNDSTSSASSCSSSISQVDVLKNKSNLTNLEINGDGYIRHGYYSKLPMKILEPHPNLRGLKIHAFRSDAELPTWLSSITNLVRLELRFNEGCKYLPPLGMLPHLQRLNIADFYDLEYIEKEEEEEIEERKQVDNHGVGGGSTPIVFFPSLKTLTIRLCYNLKGWKKKKKMDDAVPLSFPCLSTLGIFNCPSLTRMPLFPTLDEKLQLWDSSAKPLLETMMLKPSTPASSSSSSACPLSQLKVLQIGLMKELDFLPEELQNLTSLQRLDIKACPKLTCLPQAMRQHTSLQELTIKGCPLLETRLKKNEGVDWPNIAHIPYVDIRFNQD